MGVGRLLNFVSFSCPKEVLNVDAHTTFSGGP